MFGKYNKVGTRVYGGGGGIDPDAQAFITAAETAGASFTTAQKGYIDRLVKNIKGTGDINSTTDLWTISQRIHIYLGAASAPMAINVKTAISTFTFNGGWTFDANGATPNGTNGYIDTGIACNTITNNVFTNKLYCNLIGFNTNAATTSFDGYTNGSGTSLYYSPKFSDNNAYIRVLINVEPFTSQTGVDTRQIYVFRRVSDTHTIRRNKTSIFTTTDATNNNGSTTGNEYLSALNANPTPILFDNRQRNFDWLIYGTEVTSTMSDLMVDIVNAFQTDFGRNNYQP